MPESKTEKKMNKNFETREGWLKAAVESITPIFTAHGYEVPEFRVSCGWPSRGATKSNAQTIGQAWSPSCSGDDTPEMFISPVLGAEEVDVVLATLVHEVVHIVVGNDCGHRGAFKKCAVAVGLEGKMTATHAGEDLANTLAEISTDLGVYPHAKITPGKTLKKNKNRHHKFTCAEEECGFSCRASNGPVEEFGPPSHCEKVMVQEIPDDDDGEGDPLPPVTPEEPEEEEPETEEEEEEEEEEEWTPPVVKAKPVKDLTEAEAKARKAANDKESRIRRNAKKAEAEAQRIAKLDPKPFAPDLPFSFFILQHNGKKGAQTEADSNTLLRNVDGARFEFSEDGGTMWLEGTA